MGELGVLGGVIFYGHAEWIKTRILTRGILIHAFELEIWPLKVPICLYREATCTIAIIYTETPPNACIGRLCTGTVLGYLSGRGHMHMLMW